MRGAGLETVKATIEPFLLKACEGQLMVFVNGVFNEALSDMSAAGGVEGLVVGHVGGLQGAQLDEVFLPCVPFVREFEKGVWLFMLSMVPKRSLYSRTVRCHVSTAVAKEAFCLFCFSAVDFFKG